MLKVEQFTALHKLCLRLVTVNSLKGYVVMDYYLGIFEYLSNSQQQSDLYGSSFSSLEIKVNLRRKFFFEPKKSFQINESPRSFFLHLMKLIRERVTKF